MIRVFRNHVRLCTFTTAIFFLLPSGIGAYANAEKRESAPYRITVTYMPSTSNSSTSNYSGVLSGSNVGRPLQGEGGDSSGARYRYVYVKDGGSGNGPGRLMVYDGIYYVCDRCVEDRMKSSNNSYMITAQNVSQYSSSPVAITVKGENAKVIGEDITVRSEVPAKSFIRGVTVSEGGEITLSNFTLKNTQVALHASNGTIKVNNGVISESQMAIQAIGTPTRIALSNTKIKTSKGKASLYSYGGSEIKIGDSLVGFVNSHGVSSALGGKVILNDVTITGKGEENNRKNHALFLMDVGGSVTFKGAVNVADIHGILLENTVITPNSVPLSEKLLPYAAMTEVNVQSSSVTVNGDKSYGIYFRGEKTGTGDGLKKEASSEEGKVRSRKEVVNLNRTMFFVQDDAIYGNYVTDGSINLTQSTLSSENLLLKAEKGASLTVRAIASSLEGGAHVDETSTVKLYLGNNSEWILQKTQRRKPNRLSFTNNSVVSLVTLMNDSSIRFIQSKPDQNYTYQTLHIGKGTGEVYKALDGAHIHLNTYLNSGGSLEDQKTDRILIHGDVFGKTTVHVQGVSGSPGGNTGSGGNEQGISIIQVSGNASKDSFQLDGGYVALAHSPYQYALYAYGPESDLGKANSAQRLVKGSGEFWDFRLENRYFDSEPKPGVKTVVPQVPTYLLVPNALFHAGFVNIGNQNKWLESLRIVSNGMLEMRENPALFVRGFSGNHRYTSNLSVLEYGYGGELDYNGFEAGVLLQTIENAYGATSFGVIGSYEKFSLQPFEVEQSRKSTFNRGAVSLYGGMQSDTGFYADGFLSYGLFKGDVLTLARGKTATLKGNSLSASLTSGKVFMIGGEDLIWDPQVQVIYQRFQFNKVRDIDNFDVEIGNLDQWIARVGGRLTKSLTAADEARVISFYGKIHVSHDFGRKQFVRFKDAFQLGAFGSSLETGLGFNAQLSPKLVLHGDLAYQHKLTKAGFSGTSFSGGLRYNF
ncbi:autotransporter outer membrane beta-barrel domain-containing protein [Bartonella alsatica]|uniref:Outer membrane autotransporter barrel domain-containing protein n=2 Tax=Bartonella alsatica TaxID=52764 RepID=J1IWJ8_9HYPH|nr:autotransporter outer membrane beta-barrel domain-containing protein [Bartonella alsatica]EJF76002.1 outer membrane autotransporter barrel domain-containing protein [Bartonella alsatica IBS 382]QLC51756.1 autotransporter outer membrane beta-barrel domain-containing protein [Bartonella alsatica]